MIDFNKSSITDLENKYMMDCIKNGKICGDGKYTQLVKGKFNELFDLNNILLTTSCTHALEMSAILLDLKEGDEVIVPSYTFVSTVNAFMLRGAKPVFVDIEPRTLNIDVRRIEEAITSKTKAIYPVHYAGVVCDMDKINEIARKYDLYVIEDAAQAVGSYYKGKIAGSLSDMGCYSFHETKNYCMGEGGALIVNNERFLKRSEIIREKGTDRSQFFRGEVDKYTWQDIGSSFLPSDILAAMLYAQMERFDEIMNKRMSVWNRYNEAFESLEKDGKLLRPYIPEYSTHNAHMYYIILPTREIRDELISKLRDHGVQSVFHYIPLHTSPMGQKLGYKSGDLPITEEYAGRLLRLPMWADLGSEDVELVIKSLKKLI